MNVGASAAHQKFCCCAAAADASSQIANRRMLRGKVRVLSILLVLPDLFEMLEWHGVSMMLLELLPVLRRCCFFGFTPSSPPLLLNVCIRCCGVPPEMCLSACDPQVVNLLQRSCIHSDTQLPALPLMLFTRCSRGSCSAHVTRDAARQAQGEGDERRGR